MALLLLNCSADSPDIYSRFIPENIYLNDQESLIELVIEKVFYLDNAIPEYDDIDNEESGFGKTGIALDYLLPVPLHFSYKPYFYYTSKQVLLFENLFVASLYGEIQLPPPPS